ncbi:MAG: M15 family metallopeptidase [Sporichthyaceae bacterium]
MHRPLLVPPRSRAHARRRRALVGLVAGSALVGFGAYGCAADAQSYPAQAGTSTVSVLPPKTAPPAAPTPQAAPTPPPTPSASPEPTAAAAEVRAPSIRRIPDQQWERIVATGTWRPGCPVGRSDLRRVELNFVTFDGHTERGQLIVHRDIADSVVRIFSRLHAEGFPITRMEPVEKYGGDVNRSLRADNTSAFNCRKPDQINAPVKASPHANGRAVDVNPVRNPWKDLRCTCWSPSDEYATDRRGPGVVTKGSLPWRLFTGEGWIWQNIDVPDYMHFDTGYPSRPFREPRASSAAS